VAYLTCDQALRMIFSVGEQEIREKTNRIHERKHEKIN
jgi:hypothetical protein